MVHVHIEPNEQSLLFEKPDKNAEENEREEKQHVSKESHDILRGGIYLTISAVLFATVDFFVRLGTSQLFIPPSEYLFVRTSIHIIAAAVYLLIFYSRASFNSLTSQHKKAIILYGITLGFFNISLFKALEQVPVGEVTAILYSNTVFTLLFSFLFLSERIDLMQLLSIVLGIIGVILVTDVSFQHSSAGAPLMGYIYAMLTPVLMALSYISIRFTNDSVPAILLVLAAAMCGFCISFVLDGAVTPAYVLATYGPEGAALLLGSASISMFLLYFVVAGFQLFPAGPGAVLSTLAVPIAYFDGAVFLHEIPHTKQIIGSVLIVLGTALVGYDMFKGSKQFDPDSIDTV